MLQSMGSQRTHVNYNSSCLLVKQLLFSRISVSFSDIMTIQIIRYLINEMI